MITRGPDPVTPLLLVRQAGPVGERDVSALLASAGFTADHGTARADGGIRLVLLL